MNIFTRTTIYFVLFSMLLSSCWWLKPHVEQNPYANVLDTSMLDLDMALDDIPVSDNDKQNIENYRSTPTRTYKLLHTKLDVRPDWSKRRLAGKAWLTLQPYFYATNQLVLDAKGFDLHQIALQEGKKNIPLTYSYDSLQIHITLPREYKAQEQFVVYIEYTAKPDERKTLSGSAITSDKGLFFINPDGTQDKPRQLWTQGETESSSCWFPTFESSTQMTTQEIFITVEKEFVTLSNGLMVNTLLNADGTRTDHWKQTKPHAPYLFMIAAGDFTIVKDYWRDREVSYYVEPEYGKYARDIFGKTPRMIDFFSQRLGVDFAWDKYSQIVVRDYVSGAMENTSAVVFGSFMQQTKRQQLDKNYEDIIAHELFHHWFGDLVVCESWSHLPLNESFATYGACLWLEHEYGSYESDYELYQQLHGYLNEASWNPKYMIRFYYDKPDDMFDAHSYNKGGCILHSLRNYVGDEAFFESLKLYLTRYKHSATEIDHLRLAFEEVTGYDLQWFFNQWFNSMGHPVLSVQYKYNQTDQILTIQVEQKQSSDFPIFKLPLKTDVYLPDTVIRFKTLVTRARQTFSYSLSAKPLLVNIDADRALVGEIMPYKTTSEMMVQYQRAPKFLDKLEALEGLQYADTLGISDIFVHALQQPFWYLRQRAIGLYAANNNDNFTNALRKIALSDPDTRVRATAVDELARLGHPTDAALFEQICKRDSSYSTIGAALQGLVTLQSPKAIATAQYMTNDKNMIVYAAPVLATSNDTATASVIEKSYDNCPNVNCRWHVIDEYHNYIKKFGYVEIERYFRFLTQAFDNSTDTWWLRGVIFERITDLYVFCKTSEAECRDKASKNVAVTDNISWQTKAQNFAALQQTIKHEADIRYQAETNTKLLEWLGESRKKMEN